MTKNKKKRLFCNANVALALLLRGETRRQLTAQPSARWVTGGQLPRAEAKTEVLCATAFCVAALYREITS